MRFSEDYFFEPIRASKRARSLYQHLSTMDDRSLADIGLERDQIPAAVCGMLDWRRVADGQDNTAPEAKNDNHPVAA